MDLGSDVLALVLQGTFGFFLRCVFIMYMVCMVLYQENAMNLLCMKLGAAATEEDAAPGTSCNDPSRTRERSDWLEMKPSFSGTDQKDSPWAQKKHQPPSQCYSKAI